MLEEEIEALLFLYAKEMRSSQIAKILGKSEKEVKHALSKLNQRYAAKKGAIILRKSDDIYSLNVKQEYAEMLKDVIKRKELSQKAVKVLGVIKKYNGILKSKLVKVLGSTTYEAIAELREKGFVKEQKVGNSSRLTLTEKFKDYFGEA